MKNTDELMQDLREDIDRRMQAIHAHEQEKAAMAQAVTDAEAGMAAALAANDEKAYHEAEGALTFAKARRAALEGVNPWWPPDEATSLVQAMYETCYCECKDQIVEAYGLLRAAIERVQEANRLGAIGEQYQIRIKKHVQLTHSWGFVQEHATLGALRNLIRTFENKYGLRPE